MSPSDLILAAVLLTTPPGVPEPRPAADHWPAVRDAVHHVAIQWEILDARETSYLFAKVEDFDGDLTILRRRYQDLHDAPRLADSFRLPATRSGRVLAGSLNKQEPARARKKRIAHKETNLILAASINAAMNSGTDLGRSERRERGKPGVCER